jgi:hypothetical protein
MRNPFELHNFHKAQRDYTLDDFLIIGADCYICKGQVCADEVNNCIFRSNFCSFIVRNVLFFIKILIA